MIGLAIRTGAWLWWLGCVVFAADGLDVLRSAKTGLVRLPVGSVEIQRGVELPEGTHDLVVEGAGVRIRAGAGFEGRAILSCKGCRNIRFRNLTIDGNRESNERRLPLPPTDVAFARFYSGNGILIEDSDGVVVEGVRFDGIVNFALLVSASRHISVSKVVVTASGSRNDKGRNNTSGGVLLEQGTADFQVMDSRFANIRGNAVWTHSCYGSARNLRGRILRNEFADIGRDAIQVGHASEVEVSGNRGQRIGMRLEDVDVEGGGTPVGIDTAGDVDKTVYVGNRFEEVNGKCIDLDGFHDGAVRGNVCINRGGPQDYAYGNFGIAFNNTNIDMRSQNIVVEGNTLHGMKFGGIFVVGTGHRIAHNSMTRLNTAHCNENHAKYGCIAILEEPGFLESGIYLAARANRPDPSSGVVIEDNTISGWKMKEFCVRAAPGVSLAGNRIRGNRCSDE